MGSVHGKTMIAVAIIAAAGTAVVGIIIATLGASFLPSPDSHSITGAQRSELRQQEPNTSRSVPAINNSGSNGYHKVNITVNGIELIADVAETDEQRTKGLSVKNALLENEAMIFIFKTEGQHAFWMKNMKFPIDIIWLNNDKSVVHIEHNLQPCILDIFCQIYNPNTNSLYVLETAAGFADRHGIAEGTPVRFQFNPS